MKNVSPNCTAVNCVGCSFANKLCNMPSIISKSLTVSTYSINVVGEIHFKISSRRGCMCDQNELIEGIKPTNVIIGSCSTKRQLGDGFVTVRSTANPMKRVLE